MVEQVTCRKDSDRDRRLNYTWFLTTSSEWVYGQWLSVYLFPCRRKAVKGYHSSFSCCCDKCPWKINFRNKGFVLAHSSREESFMVGGSSRSRSSRKVVLFCRRSRQHSVRKSRAFWCSPYSLLFIQSETQAYGTVPPTLTLGLPTSVNFIMTNCRSYAQVNLISMSHKGVWRHVS